MYKHFRISMPTFPLQCTYTTGGEVLFIRSPTEEDMPENRREYKV